MKNPRSSEKAPSPTSSLFSVVRPKRAFEEVVEQVRREVASGRLKPGDRLPPEREFAEQLGLSRTAVREAMRTLENAGLVQCQAGMNGGAFIRAKDSTAMTQALSDLVLLGQIPTSSVMEVRILITAHAIRLACARGTPEDFVALQRDVENAEELTRRGDFTRRHAYINSFYVLLAQATHNQVIVAIMESLAELTRALLVKSNLQPRSDVLAVRRKVLKLMQEGKADDAVKEMTAHLKRLEKAIQDLT